MFFLYWVLLSTSAYGEKISYPVQRIRAAGIDAIQVIGVKGRLKFIGKQSPHFRLNVRHTKNKRSQDWYLSVDRRGSTLVLEVFNVAHGAQWRNHVKKDVWPEFDLELSGPPRPLTVSWREGDLRFEKWTAPVESSHLKGRLEARGGAGNWRLQTGKGDVKIENLAGHLDLQGESGQLVINGLKGDLQLRWMEGKIELNDIAGSGTVENHKADLRLNTCRKEWRISQDGGSARVQNCSGILRADGKNTKWEITGTTSLNAEIKSETGPVRVRWPKGGAKVFLTSQSGGILGDSIAPILDPEGRKVATFQIGKKPSGRLFVQTDSGDIQFRQ